MTNNPPIIHRFPALIHAAARAFVIAKSPISRIIDIHTIPNRILNIQHHFGSGVCPFAKALICTIAATKKKIRKMIVAGNRNHFKNPPNSTTTVAGSFL